MVEFVNGLRVYAPNEKAPEFVKAAITINVSEMQEWLSSRQEENVRIDVKQSKGGNWYAAVNDFKPKQSDHDKAKADGYAPDSSDGGFVDDDLKDCPF